MKKIWPMLTAGVLLCGASAGAQDDKPIRVNIRAQTLTGALNEWAQATGFQLMSLSEATHHATSPGLQGAFTATEALHRLLEGTSLTYELVNERTVAIQERPSRRSSANLSEGKQTLRLAAAQSPDTRVANSASGSANNISQDLEEVIVTAQKREQRLEEVPISISVLGGVELDASTVQGMTEALGRVPGVATNAWFQGGTNVAIRGVSASGPVFNGASPVSYYLDTVPFGFVKSAIGPDTSAYDLERVEVLRGPQGTLYGASAQNGVVRVLTKDPNLEDFELKLRTSGSHTEGGGENYRGDMAVNVPIVEGKVAARAVVGYQDLSGWIDKPNEKNANDSEIANMRLKLYAQPTQQLSVGLSAWLSRADYGAPAAGDSNNRTNNLVDEPGFADYDAYGLKVGYEFTPFDVTSTTSFLDYESSTVFDHLPVAGFSTQFYNVFNSDVFSQEILLNSTHGGRWRWSVGGMYRDAEDWLFQNIVGLFAAPIHLREHSESFAAFGEVGLLFLDGRVELSGGVRYFEDEVTSEELSAFSGAPPAGEYARASFDAVSPRVVLNWRPNERTTLYASYAEGFRSGFSQLPAVAAIGFPPVEPDTLVNYEVGAKGNLWDGRVQYETAVYFTDWEDVQQTLTVPFGAIVITGGVNGESASGMGVDFGVSTQPLDGLELGVNFNWNDLTFDGDVISAGTVLFSQGDRLNLSPEYTVGASADYSFDLSANGLSGRFSTSANYISEQDLRTIVRGQQYIANGDSMLITRASFAVNSPQNWTATLFVDNANNEQGSPVRLPFSGRPLPTRDARIRPRTFGLQVDYHF